MHTKQSGQLILCGIVSLAVGVSIGASVTQAKKPSGEAPPGLKREEMKVFNLNHGPTSARFYIAESMKAARIMERDLDKAEKQVEQVDAAYAKAKNRPDDLTMRETAGHLRNALGEVKQLQSDLLDSAEQLNSDIKQTLLR